MIDGVIAMCVFFRGAFVVRVCAGFGRVNSLFMRSFGFDFGALERAESANFFDGFCFLSSVVGNLNLIDDVDLFRFLFFVLFLVVFVECSAADNCISGSVRLNFVLLRFDDA